MPVPPTLVGGAPDPAQRHPVAGHPRVAFLNSICTRPTIEAGDYSYYDDPTGPERFEDENVLYHYEAIGDRLRIGRFCAIAAGATFIMNGANHRLDGISTFPFPIFGGAWAAQMPLLADTPARGDTVVGHDVWLGWRSVVLPGVTIGNGAIVAACAVVTQDVPPYAVVAGNPARVVKRRFSPDDVARLERAAWWDWPVARLAENLDLVMRGDVDALIRASRA